MKQNTIAYDTKISTHINEHALIENTTHHKHRKNTPRHWENSDNVINAICARNTVYVVYIYVF